MNQQQERVGGVSFLGLLALLFILLKLTKVIDWSWWWVLAPLWLPASICFAAAAVFGLIGLTVYLIKRHGHNKRVKAAKPTFVSDIDRRSK